LVAAEEVEAAIGADSELDLIIFNLPPPSGLTEDHIELIAQRAVAEKVMEAGAGVDQDPVNDCSPDVDRRRHTGKRVVGVQPGAVDEVSPALSNLLVLSCDRHQALAGTTNVRSTGGTTTRRSWGATRNVRSCWGTMIGLFMITPQCAAG
jgi:hypothetical protein